MAEGTIVKCPNCKPPLMIRRADGSRIIGFLPMALYIGYLRLPKRYGVPRPPATCPECDHILVNQERRP